MTDVARPFKARARTSVSSGDTLSCSELAVVPGITPDCWGSYGPHLEGNLQVLS